MLLRKPKVTAAVFAIVFALAYRPSAGVSETPIWKPVPPGDEIVWATVAISGFSGHECGEVVEAKRLPDGTIRAKCVSGEYFRIAFEDGAPIAVRCADAEKQGIKDC
jgi:hypothetical protein